MTWTVTGITDTGAVQLHNQDRRQDTTVDADYVRQHLHLAYATTVHGVQGDTADHADSLLTDGTDAAAAYVGLTRGRHTNTVHIVADTLDEAREQWVARGRPEPRRPRPRPGPRRGGDRSPHHRTPQQQSSPGWSGLLDRIVGGTSPSEYGAVSPPRRAATRRRCGRRRHPDAG